MSNNNNNNLSSSFAGKFCASLLYMYISYHSCSYFVDCCESMIYAIFVTSLFQSLVIDQTIEKVSFCTPDPSNERVFSYICRDGTTRRWICHCFIAMRDTVSV